MSTLVLPEHCLGCAACCVSHDHKWVEVSPSDEVRINDPTLLQSGDIDVYAMRMARCRCVALTGDVGRDAACSIYARRPEICRFVERGSDICRQSLRAFIAVVTS